MSPSTPREQLARWRAQLSRVFRRSLDRHDRTQAEVAQSVGATPQKVQLWTDHHRLDTPTIAHLALMPDGVLEDLISPILDERGLRLVGCGAHLAGADEQGHLEHLRDVIRECSDVQRDYASALVGGITRPEREALRREISEAISALAQLDHALKIEGKREAAAFGGPRGIA